MSVWQLDRWGAVRVAGLPAEVLPALRLQRAPELWQRMQSADLELSRARDELIDEIFVTISRAGMARDTRRYLLSVKRDLHNGRTIIAGPPIDELDPALTCRLDALERAEHEHAALAQTYEDAASVEWTACELAIWPWLGHPRLLDGLILSNVELARYAIGHAEGLPPSAPTRRQLKTLAGIGMYLLRATTRPTPFSTFCAVGLIAWDEAPLGERPAQTASARAATSRVRLDIGLLQEHVAAVTAPHASEALSVAISPWRVSDGELVVFPGVAYDADRGITTHWFAAQEAELARILELGSDNETIATLLGRLRATTAGSEPWAHRVEELLDAGLVRCRLPRVEPSAHGVAAAAAWVRDVTGEDGGLSLTAGYLAAYPDAGPARRLDIVEAIATTLRRSQRDVLYEDILLDGESLPHAGLPTSDLLETAGPALQLVHSSMSELPHILMCEAFLARFGPDGRCDDVPALLTSLWRDNEFVERVRQALSAPAWLKSPIVEAAGRTDRAVVECPGEWFDDLPRTADHCDVALLFQVVAADAAALAAGQYTIVLNDVQSGRGKYLSRYLGGEDDTSRRALADIRESLARDVPRPIEVRATLGTNFQLHPRLCHLSLELGDPCDTGDRSLPLDDLSLEFDVSARRLVLSSASLGQPVEPLHLGFLRDGNLPTPLFLLRALSPRYRDETVSERVALYRVLDGRALVRGEQAPRFRPRLQVGRLIIERARWMVPLDEVPRYEAGAGAGGHVSRVLGWLQREGLPERCTAQVWQTLPGGVMELATPVYIDWYSPLAVAAVRSLARATRGGPEQEAPSLVLRELLPAPEDALLHVDGKAHVAEWLAQFRLRS